MVFQREPLAKTYARCDRCELRHICISQLIYASKSESKRTLASDASSLDSWELRSCSSASSWSNLRLTAHTSRSLSCTTKQRRKEGQAGQHEHTVQYKRKEDPQTNYCVAHHFFHCAFKNVLKCCPDLFSRSSNTVQI